MVPQLRTDLPPPPEATDANGPDVDHGVFILRDGCL